MGAWCCPHVWVSLDACILQPEGVYNPKAPRHQGEHERGCEPPDLWIRRAPSKSWAPSLRCGDRVAIAHRALMGIGMRRFSWLKMDEQRYLHGKKFAGVEAMNGFDMLLRGVPVLVKEELPYLPWSHNSWSNMHNAYQALWQLWGPKPTVRGKSRWRPLVTCAIGEWNQGPRPGAHLW